MGLTLLCSMKILLSMLFIFRLTILYIVLYNKIVPLYRGEQSEVSFL